MKRDIEKFVSALMAGVLPPVYQSPVDWAERNIIFAKAKDPIKGKLSFDISPFLRDPVSAWEIKAGSGLKEVTAIGPQQTGKTLTWLSGLLYSCEFRPGNSLIYYTSEPKGQIINKEKVRPVLEHIPKYKSLLQLPGSANLSNYTLGQNIIHFGGVGSRISSFSAGVLIADEIDDWIISDGESPLDDLRFRARMFSEAILYKVCSIKGTKTQSRIYKEFLKSSRGIWFLRCRGCGELTMRSCDIHNLQFKTKEDGSIAKGSGLLFCPACGKSHAEHEKIWMNQNGKYIHKNHELLDTSPGFLWGALASQMPSLAWDVIGAAQLAAGRSGTLEDQIKFDNSFRSLPFEPRRSESKTLNAVKKHCIDSVQGKIVFRFMSADTQNDCFYGVIRGIDSKMNSYLLAEERLMTIEDLDRFWSGNYAGGKPLAGIIDEGGQRALEVQEFVRKRAGLFTYKGNPKIGCNFKESKENRKLILANPHFYKDRLLYRIFSDGKSEKDGWYIAIEPSAAYWEQISSYRANNAVRDGDEIENYISNGNDHFFDAEKMMLVLFDYFVASILPRIYK